MKTFLYNRVGAVEDIIEQYKNVTMTVTDIAKKYNVTPRSIQRLLKKHGVVRTIAEANKVTARLKNYDALKVPDYLKVKRHHLTRKQRYEILQANPRCATCGATKENAYLQIDHKDGNPSNNKTHNLQVLCILCNQGKK